MLFRSPGGGAEYHGTIITISESSIEPGNIWVGTDDGNIQVTKNGGATWDKVGTATLPGIPQPDFWVSRVEASHFARGTAYASVDGHRMANYAPFVYKTTDYGKTWTKITSGLPDGHPIYVVKEDLKNPNLLFAGSEFAAFYSLDGGGNSSQKRYGIEDSADLLFKDLTDWSVVQPNGFPDYRYNDHEIIRAYADNAAATHEFLLAHGVDLSTRTNVRRSSRRITPTGKTA